MSGPTTTGRVDTVVLDVDGTLVDSNYQHALAWFRAFRRFDLTLPLWRIHRGIGMGGDQLVAHLTDDDTEARIGDDVRAAWAEEFDPMLDEVAPMAGVTELLAAIKEAGVALVLASSGKPEHVHAYLDLVDGARYADAWTTAEDADATKPAPDLVRAAVSRVDGRHAVMVGDSVYDAEAAARIDVPTYAVRTGGFSVDELRAAGARAVYDSLDEVRADLGTVLTRS